jgi:uncharacterized protein (TIGR03643 family)
MSFTKLVQEKELTQDDLDRIVRMGWEDRTSFEAIKLQFQITEKELLQIMRNMLGESAFKKWRKRSHEQGHLKHEKKRGFKVGRFKCYRQRSDGSTKGWK